SLQTFAAGFIGRPLLSTRSKDLKAYLNANGLSWVEDESNAESCYKRNFIRHKLLPIADSEFANATENCAKTAENTADSLRLLNILAGFEKNHLPLAQIKAIPPDLQATYFYHWLSAKNLPVMDKKTIKQVLADFLTARADKNPYFSNQFYQLYRWQEAIYWIENFETIDEKCEFIWNTAEDFIFPNNCGRLSYKGDACQLRVKFQQRKSQKLKTHQHKFHKTIKQLLQEQQIPPWQRVNTPYIYAQNELVSLGFAWSHQQKFSNNIQLNFNFSD
ncbi:MAG TPA: hypothetical protein ENJ44_01940, partial [Oceanospirillales bacterium]|nr:hypothetical protein [Oceanospirillales bacterium]